MNEKTAGDAIQEHVRAFSLNAQDLLGDQFEQFFTELQQLQEADDLVQQRQNWDAYLANQRRASGRSVRNDQPADGFDAEMRRLIWAELASNPDVADAAEQLDKLDVLEELAGDEVQPFPSKQEEVQQFYQELMGARKLYPGMDQEAADLILAREASQQQRQLPMGLGMDLLGKGVVDDAYKQHRRRVARDAEEEQGSVSQHVRTRLLELNSLHQNYKYQRLFYDGLIQHTDTFDPAKVLQEFEFARKRFDCLLDDVEREIAAHAAEKEAVDAENERLETEILAKRRNVAALRKNYLELHGQVAELRTALSHGMGHRLDTFCANYDAWQRVAREKLE